MQGGGRRVLTRGEEFGAHGGMPPGRSDRNRGGVQKLAGDSLPGGSPCRRTPCVPRSPRGRGGCARPPPRRGEHDLELFSDPRSPEPSTSRRTRRAPARTSAGPVDDLDVWPTVAEAPRAPRTTPRRTTASAVSPEDSRQAPSLARDERSRAREEPKPPRRVFEEAASPAGPARASAAGAGRRRGRRIRARAPRRHRRPRDSRSGVRRTGRLLKGCGMALRARRRNPKGGRHFAGGRSSAMKYRSATTWIGRRMQSAGHDARIHLSAAC